MRENGRGARHRNAGDVGRPCGCLGTARGAVIPPRAKIVCRFRVVVDGESRREWSERDVVEVGVGAAGLKAAGVIELPLESERLHFVYVAIPTSMAALEGVA